MGGEERNGQEWVGRPHDKLVGKRFVSRALGCFRFCPKGDYLLMGRLWRSQFINLGSGRRATIFLLIRISSNRSFCGDGNALYLSCPVLSCCH